MSASSGVNYARRLARLRARIFGDVVRKTEEGDMRVVKLFARLPRQRELPEWYPPITKYNTILLRLRHFGLYHDNHLDFQEAMQRQRKERGKGPPKKGKGKRAKTT